MSGNIPGYMPQKQGGEGSPVQFSVVFNFEGRGAERIVMTPADHAPGPPIGVQPDREFPTVVEPLPAGDGEDDAIEEDV